MSAELFNEHYQKLFGTEWPRLLEALHTERRPILRFSDPNAEKLRTLFAQHNLEWQQLPWFPNAVYWPESVPLHTDLPGNNEHLFYVMSPSSLLPVLALDAQPGEDILDACAAPGGKTLALAEVTPSKTKITANDTSPERRRRMQDIFLEYGHPEIRIWGKKAETLFKQYPSTFDRILLDAPCSSEMHVVRSPQHLAQWTTGRSRSLQYRQVALLCGLFQALKVGGRIVYSTCAITPDENDRVVERFLKKNGDRARQLPWPANIPGPKILPHTDNMDPMFVAIFERVA